MSKHWHISAYVRKIPQFQGLNENFGIINYQKILGFYLSRNFQGFNHKVNSLTVIYYDFNFLSYALL